VEEEEEEEQFDDHVESEEEFDSDDEDIQYSHKCNYGDRVDGPWTSISRPSPRSLIYQILEFACRKSKEWMKETGRGGETRFFLVPKRDRATL
jgi:hypothetical protein